MKRLQLITLFFFALLTCFGQNDELDSLLKFDEVKWRNDSGYRYDFVQTKAFSDLTDQPMNEVKQLLGEPDKTEELTLFYCLDLDKSDLGDRICKGSHFSINFGLEASDPLRVTFIRSGG
jgi:hypothetical protein